MNLERYTHTKFFALHIISMGTKKYPKQMLHNYISMEKYEKQKFHDDEVRSCKVKIWKGGIAIGGLGGLRAANA